MRAARNSDRSQVVRIGSGPGLDPPDCSGSRGSMPVQIAPNSFCQMQTSKTRVRAAGNSDRAPRSHVTGCQASKTAFRSRCARPGGSEAFCPNIQPRAHARLTGLTTRLDARNASEMQPCWLDKTAYVSVKLFFTLPGAYARCALFRHLWWPRSPNQVLTHAARGAREGLWLEQVAAR